MKSGGQREAIPIPKRPPEVNKMNSGNIKKGAGQIIVATVDQLAQEAGMLFMTTLRSLRESGSLNIDDAKIVDISRRATLTLESKKANALSQLEKI
jgi:hypothetical protein